MKRFLSILLIVSLLFSLCASVSAAELAEIAISDITPPVSNAQPQFTAETPANYRIVSQAWIEYRDGEITRACIIGDDSYYADAYWGLPLLEHFEEGLNYRYTLVLTTKDRLPFASVPSLRLCGESVTGALSDRMHCVYEASFLCQDTAENAPIQITVKPPMLGEAVDRDPKITEGYVITELRWTDKSGKLVNGTFQAETDHTLRIRFRKEDDSAFAALPNVSINGQAPKSRVLTHANLCTVQFTFPYGIHIQEITLPSANTQPQFCTETQHSSYCILHQEWQELTPGGFLGRRCMADANGNPIAVGSEALLTEFLPGFTYNLHLTLGRADGIKMTQTIPLTVGGRNAKSSLSNGKMLCQSVFTVPFNFEVTEPFSGSMPSFHGISYADYSIVEAWMRLNENGDLLQYITSDAELNDTIPLSHRLTRFEHGERYTYAVDIMTPQGYPLTFVPEAYVNGLEMHAELYNEGLTLGYQRSFTCTNVDKRVQFAHTLSLQNDISIQFISKLEQLADYDSYYLECTLPVYDGDTKIGERTLCIEPTEENGLCYFLLDGVSAKQMNDEIKAVIHMTKDGIAYTSRTDTYSVAEYAYNMLNKDGKSDALKQLCADLLRYGAQAQSYFSYRTDALADAAMTGAHNRYLSDLSSVSLTNHMQMLDDMQEPTLKWKSASLVLGNRITLKFIANLNGYAGSIETLSAHISYEDGNGIHKTVRLTEFVPIEGSEGLYEVECDFLAAKDLRSVLTATLYEGDVQCARSVRYSVESYASRQQGVLLTLCKAMMAYSDSARNFFTNT